MVQRKFNTNIKQINVPIFLKTIAYSGFKNLKEDKPLLKSAYIEESFYFGDDQVEVLCSLKSKDELIGEIITLLQSPPKTVISSLQSAGSQLSGILKTLSERSE